MAKKAKFQPTIQLIEDILARIPEGFIPTGQLRSRLSGSGKQIDQLVQDSQVERADGVYYDSARLSEEEVYERKNWCKPSLPAIHEDGHLPEAAITDQFEMREHYLEHANRDDMLRIVQKLAQTPGYAPPDALCDSEADAEALDELLEKRILRRRDDLIYDPLRLGHETMRRVSKRHHLEPIHAELTALLETRPGQTAPRDELIEKFGKQTFFDVLTMGGFAEFKIKTRRADQEPIWVRLKGSDTKQARQVAEDSVRIKDEEWQAALDFCGERLREGAKDGNTRRAQVVARSYTINRAGKRLNIRQGAIERAINSEAVSSFVDPEDRPRIPAYEVEAAMEDDQQAERFTAYEIVKARDIATVTGLGYSTIRRRLSRAGISRTQPLWGEVRGKWNLPETFYEYKMILDTRIAEEKARRAAQHAEEQRKIQEQLERERQEREELRARLVNAFPTWRHEDRHEQRIYLHIGPPNSGKTHDAINRLIEAGSGWYLAPLRLLAFEVFDRLNQRGIPCNLLTGEEHIPIPGATITAATIEMLNANESGECVVIDEAQLLADPDRGWAWTRAMMQTQAPEIHMIGPLTARNLIEKLSNAASIPLDVIEHKRLTPIQVADRHYPLNDLPPHTILVAFSRRMVLQLKTELESRKRTVSVVYGSLPPEVRRKQADRFASGETDICIATDAVGMGLNLPADRVIFFELQKFDGREVRDLTSAEVQQIGGRAGRYGIRESGEVATTQKRDMALLKRLFNSPMPELTHARVAPTVEDLEIIPGSLHERLYQWSLLESIPDSLRGAVKTADLTSRIELAGMLTDEQVEQLGMATALQLVNAPTRRDSRLYWLDCAHAILGDHDLPIPPGPPSHIEDSNDLEDMESCIACADIYLWLAQRREFGTFGPDRGFVHEARLDWSAQIDDALLRKIDAKRRCPSCGKSLPPGHRFRLCDECFFSGVR